MFYALALLNVFVAAMAQMLLKKAATYVKLADAYIAEIGDTLSSFSDIGYEISNTANFTYTDSWGAKAALTTKAAWTATSVVALNDCAKGKTWVLTANQSSTGNGAAWTTGALDAECKALTPQFEKLAKGTVKSSS